MNVIVLTVDQRGSRRTVDRIPDALSALVQTLGQGLSARSELGAGWEELLAVAHLALTLVNES